MLIVPTTQPEEIEQYGIRVAEQWKLGRKGVDDGAILLVAKNDRRVRIEVGYGLEGALPDAIANRIIDETITPHFKLGDYDGGVEAGVDQMISVVNGEPLPEPDTPMGAPRGLGQSAAAAAGGRLRRERRSARHVRPAVRFVGDGRSRRRHRVAPEPPPGHRRRCGHPWIPVRDAARVDARAGRRAAADGAGASAAVWAGVLVGAAVSAAGRLQRRGGGFGGGGASGSW